MAIFSRPQYLNIARPYALAIFEYAQQSKQLSLWLDFLNIAANIVRQDSVKKLLTNPAITPKQWVDILKDILVKNLNTISPEAINFLSLLAQNKRLVVLPEITVLYNGYYAAFEKTRTVKVITAVTPEQSFQNKLLHTLKKRMQQDIAFEYEVNPNIIGGAIIKIGDKVIDGSIRGKLTRLFQNLSG